MQHKSHLLTSITAAMLIFLSACGGNAQPTLDAAVISTAAAQTVEARFTQQAAAFTATPLPPTATSTPAPTETPAITPTQSAGGAPNPNPDGKACFTMTLVGETVPDGMIIAPGTTFTKTWQLRNDGNCTWDQNYVLELVQGDALGASSTQFPLKQVVNPGDTISISIDMTAPTTPGDYAGYWKIMTPFGGYMGVGSYNQAIFVKITSSSKPDRDFGSVSVAYDYTRRPAKGCTEDGAYYDFTATISVNAPGEIDYRWDRNPFDGEIVGGTLKFVGAGSKTVYWTWHMTKNHIQNIDRWIAITTMVGTKETYYPRITFRFTCDQ